MLPEKIRSDFPVLRRRFNGRPVIYLDSAATSLKPGTVIDAVCGYYSNIGANIMRGLHTLSEEGSRLWEAAHETVAGFVGARAGEIAFTQNATHSLNTVMYGLYNSGFFSRGDEILVSRLEHHSNLMPWQFLERKAGIKLRMAELNSDFTLDTADFNSKLSERTKLVSVSHASNVVGSILPVRELRKAARQHNALFVVDASQSMPHMHLDAKEIGADFLAFSGHKMLGPFGIGVLYGKAEHLESISPMAFGGGMISEVREHEAEFAKPPEKFEAGTPDIASAIGFGKAVEYLQGIGMERVEKHCNELLAYALEKLPALEKNAQRTLSIYCPRDVKKQVPIISFNVKGMDSHDVALALNEADNIAVRSGMLCAQPIAERLGSSGAVRASFYIYNTKAEIDRLVAALSAICGAKP